MIIEEHIKISQIVGRETKSLQGDFCSIVLLTGNVKGLVVDGTMYTDVSSSIFFLNPNHSWRIVKQHSRCSSGYIMHLSGRILNEPALSKLKVNEMRILHSDVVHKTQLSPGIQCRVKTILEMLDELLTTHLHHRVDAILSLINAFFIYCDGQCNIKSNIDNHNGKASLVYKFKKLISGNITKWHNVGAYASSLHISPKYLNECVQEILQTSAKGLIIEQLSMRARHDLKFSDKSIKEVAFDLGFSSPTYFSSFCKKHLGCSPAQYRKG